MRRGDARRPAAHAAARRRRSSSRATRRRPASAGRDRAPRAARRGPRGRCARTPRSRRGCGGCPRSSTHGCRRPRAPRSRGSDGGEGREHRVVGDVAGGEHQRRVLAVQRGELRLERDDRVVGAGDVAGAAGAGAIAREREAARLEHQRMAAHAEVVVAAPDGDGAAHAIEGRERDRARRELAPELAEHAVALLAPQSVERVAEEAVVVEAGHRAPGFQCRPSARPRRAP